MITIISAVYDRYDTVKPVCPQTVPCRWIMVTDHLDTEAEAEQAGWTAVYEPVPGHPNRAAKRPKLHPWMFTPDDASIWVDASIRITSPTFAEDLLDLAWPLAQFAHPDRDCIYPEAALSETLPRYRGEPNVAQADHYRAEGHPERWGLWATGIIARRHTLDVLSVSEAWQAEINRWSFQDQISYPVALRNVGIRPRHIPHGSIWESPWATYEASRRHITG